jgi:DNA-binding transcriptional ArsR family regulator
VPHNDLDKVFRALADAGRRLLLDSLYTCDGQTLSELCGRLRRITRFGTLKHLSVLAEAGLVTSDKSDAISSITSTRRPSG